MVGHSNRAAEVVFVGHVYASVLQVNVRVPKTLPASVSALVPLNLSIAGVSAPPNQKFRYLCS